MDFIIRKTTVASRETVKINTTWAKQKQKGTCHKVWQKRKSKEASRERRKVQGWHLLAFPGDESRTYSKLIIEETRFWRK